MQRRYITVNVFTDRAFGGNPLAVVLPRRKIPCMTRRPAFSP